MKAKRPLSFAFSILVLVGTATAQTDKGYKGMVNVGWILLSEDVSFEALTIHGYQFNPHLFLEEAPESTIILLDLMMRAISPFSQTFAVIFLKDGFPHTVKLKLGDKSLSTETEHPASTLPLKSVAHLLLPKDLL